MLKLIAFDIDNTLAELDKAMKSETIEALKELEKKQVQILFISGRPVSYVTGFVRQIGLENPIVSGSNGGVVKESITVPPKGYYCMAVSDYQRRQMQLIYKELEDHFGDKIWFQPNQMQISVFHYTVHVRKELEDFVETKFDDAEIRKAFKAYMHFDCIDIMPVQVSKGNGLLYVVEQMGIPQEATIAVGDSINDHSMFAKAHRSIGINMDEKLEHVSHVPDIDSAIELINQWLEE